MDERPVLELRGITKRFPGIVANDGVDFDLRKGEVHALLGENGAGKSTLMNVVYGLYRPDEGDILINGKPAELGSPKAAIENGIGMVHQHFMLIPVMTVAENIVLATEPTHNGILLDYDAAEKRVREISTRFGLAVDPRAVVQDITVGQQQRVEILKALYRGADILVLDEPTAVLTPQEAHELFTIIRGLTEQGKSIIFISHKLNEVTEVADRITVLRRGKKIETLPAKGATEEGLARLMVGREVLLRVDKTVAQPGQPLLSVRGLTVEDDRGIEQVRDVSFEVNAGEIVGIAGVDGNGQTELIDAIAGLRKSKAGTIVIGDEDVTGDTCKECLDAGLGHIPEDRQRRGLVLDFSLAENIALHDYDHKPASRFGWLYPKRLAEKARVLLEEFDVRGGGPQTRAGGLSGGNQQKVVLAREIDRNPKVLIAAQPTRGLDVGAIEFVHRRLVGERDEGRGVLLVSLELDEILSLSDRILVIFEGRIVGEFPPGVSEEELGVAMTGGVVVFATTGSNPLSTYKAIFEGAGLNWFIEVGSHELRVPFTDAHIPFPWNVDDIESTAAFNLQQTLINFIPLALTGLAVGFAFKCGLFNIGGQGQYLAGAVMAVWVGSSLPGLPGLVHILLAVVAGALMGALWAGIAGVLKALVGTHEVISTIMLNWIAIWVGVFLFGLGGPLQNDTQPFVPVSNDILDESKLGILWGDPVLQALHVGFFVALVALVVYWITLNRTTLGYEVRAVGHNPEAARYGGISVARNYFLAMAISGMFAGLAGAIDITGWAHRINTNDVMISSQIAFVGIAVALLGRNKAIGIGLSAMLFASLVTGTSTRNLDPEIFQPELASNLTVMIQGLVVLFVGADVLILSLLGLRRRRRQRTAEVVPE